MLNLRVGLISGLIGGVITSTAIAQTAGSTTPTDPSAAAALALAQANAANAQATAQQTAIAVRAAQQAYDRSALPTSGATNQTTANTNAGQIEAQVLASRELRKIADSVESKVRDKLTGTCTVIIAPSSLDLSLSTWAVFSQRTTSIQKQLGQAIASYTTVDRAYPLQAPKTRIAAAAAVGTAIATVANLASYFVSNNTIGGVTVATNDEAMVAAIAGKLAETKGSCSIFSAAHLQIPSSNDNVVATLSGLDDQAYSAAVDLANAQVRSIAAKIGDKKDQPTPESQAWDKVATNLTTALTSYTALGTSLSDTGGLPLSKVMTQHAIYEQFQSAGAHILVATYVSAGGGYFTQTNLWTVFGVVPFHVSGGSVVAYMLIDGKSGKLEAAGTVEGETAYVNMSHIASKQ